jgi:soluble lytic murein transglycosylase
MDHSTVVTDPRRTDPRRGAPPRRQKPLPRRLQVQRRRESRRRGLIVLGGLLAIAVILVIVGLPFAKKAIQHFELPLQYSSIIRQQAHDKNLDPALIAAVIYAETRYSPRTSPTGAEGLMQLEPATAEFLAKRSHGTTFKVADLGEPEVNIAYGSYYLRYLLNQYNNNEVLALAAYNGGETNVDNWIRKAQESGKDFEIKDIPIGQTQAYVKEVLQKQQEYRQRYPRQLGYE